MLQCGRVAVSRANGARWVRPIRVRARCLIQGWVASRILQSSTLLDGDDSAVRQTLVNAGTIFDVARQLAAGSGNVITARLAYRGHNTGIHQTLSKNSNP